MANWEEGETSILHTPRVKTKTTTTGTRNSCMQMFYIYYVGYSYAAFVIFCGPILDRLNPQIVGFMSSCFRSLEPLRLQTKAYQNCVFADHSRIEAAFCIPVE